MEDRQTEDEKTPEVFDSLEAMLKPMNTTKDVARIGIPEGTLAYWRSMGIGPYFVKVGRTVLYAKEDVVSYMRSHRIQSTDQAVAC